MIASGTRRGLYFRPGRQAEILIILMNERLACASFGARSWSGICVELLFHEIYEIQKQEGYYEDFGV